MCDFKQVGGRKETFELIFGVKREKFRSLDAFWTSDFELVALKSEEDGF